MCVWIFLNMPTNQILVLAIILLSFSNRALEYCSNEELLGFWDGILPRWGHPFYPAVDLLCRIYWKLGVMQSDDQREGCLLWKKAFGIWHLLVCVCVKHLNRCKTSTQIAFFMWLSAVQSFFNFVRFNVRLHVLSFTDSHQFLSVSAGGHRRPIELCPTKLSMVSLGYPGWSPGRTCEFHFVSVMARG